MKITWCLGGIETNSLQETYDKAQDKVLTDRLNTARANAIHNYINSLDTSYQQKIEALDTYKQLLVN